MSTADVKLKKIDTLKPINQMNYSHWKTQLLTVLKTNKTFLHFLDLGKTWTCLYDDQNRGQTGEDIKKLESMMVILETYGPESLSDEIINFCTSIKNYFDRICKLFCIESIPTTIFQYNRKRKGFKHDSNQSYQNFYLDLRATRYQVLMNEDSSVEDASDMNVMMPPVIERSVVVDWLEGIDERLLDFVKEKYAQQLQTCTLYDIQNKISQHIDSFLKDLATPKRTDVKRDVKDDSLLMLVSNGIKLVKNESTSNANLWLDKIKSLCSLSDDDIKNVARIRTKVEKIVSNLPNPIQMHNPNRVKSFHCDICGKLFKEEYLVKRHKKVHKDVLDFKCDECTKTFVNNNGLKHHKISHTGIKPFMCDECPVTFTTKASFKKHKLIHTGERPFQCDICEKWFYSGPDMRTHKKLTHGAKTNMYKNGDLPSNIETETFMCDICSRTFIEKRYLMVHQAKTSCCSSNPKKIRKKLEKTSMCDLCPKRFRGKGELRVHYTTHTGEKPFTCHECGKGFTGPAYLKIHKRSHSGERPFTCDECDKGFQVLSSLISHKNIHSGEKPFMCDQCPSAFISKAQLRKHKAIHSNMFPCDKCKKPFTCKAELIRHETIHDDSGQRPFVCDECGKGFLTIDILKKHKVIHTGQKTNICEQCQRSFRTRRNLLRHKLTHSGEKPFKCEKCDEAFLTFSCIEGTQNYS